MNYFKTFMELVNRQMGHLALIQKNFEYKSKDIVISLYKIYYASTILFI